MTITYQTVLIGTGGIANTHMEALRQAGERVQVAAAMDVDGDRVAAFAEMHGIPQRFTDAEKLFSQIKPDLVVIATPPATHADLIIAGLEAGAWVFCEKPLCASLAEFDRIDEAERRTGRYASTVFQWRFGSAAQHLKRQIESGELGRPLVVTCLTLWYRTLAYYQVAWRGKWSTEFGGPTMGHGIHLTDLLLWLMGGWAEVRAMMGTLDRPIELEDVAMALVRFENGAMGSITNSVLSPRQETYLRLDFQRCTVEMTGLYFAGNSNWRYSVPEGAADESLLERLRDIGGDVVGGHGAQLIALLDSMDRGERPLVSGAEARRILEFSASLYKSAITGQPVQRGTLTPQDDFYHAMNGHRG